MPNVSATHIIDRMAILIMECAVVQVMPRKANSVEEVKQIRRTNIYTAICDDVNCSSKNIH